MAVGDSEGNWFADEFDAFTQTSFKNKNTTEIEKGSHQQDIQGQASEQQRRDFVSNLYAPSAQGHIDQDFNVADKATAQGRFTQGSLIHPITVDTDKLAMVDRDHHVPLAASAQISSEGHPTGRIYVDSRAPKNPQYEEILAHMHEIPESWMMNYMVKNRMDSKAAYDAAHAAVTSAETALTNHLGIKASYDDHWRGVASMAATPSKDLPAFDAHTTHHELDPPEYRIAPKMNDILYGAKPVNEEEWQKRQAIFTEQAKEKDYQSRGIDYRSPLLHPGVTFEDREDSHTKGMSKLNQWIGNENVRPDIGSLKMEEDLIEQSQHKDEELGIQLNEDRRRIEEHWKKQGISGKPQVFNEDSGGNKAGGGKLGDMLDALQQELDDTKNEALMAPPGSDRFMMMLNRKMNSLREQIRFHGGKPRGDIKPDYKVAAGGDPEEVATRRAVIRARNNLAYTLRSTPGLSDVATEELERKLQELNDQLEQLGGMRIK